MAWEIRVQIVKYMQISQFLSTTSFLKVNHLKSGNLDFKMLY